jgi:hypothetical protein
MSGRFVLEAVGGLGNRMRALDSAIGFCRQYDKELHLVWPFFKGLNCPFDKLFEKPEIVQSISSPSEYSRSKIIRNLKVTRRKIARNFYRFIYDKVIFKKQIYTLQETDYDFRELAEFGNIRLQTDQKFFQTKTPYRDLQPIPPLLAEIEKYRIEFSTSNAVGIHIRRTDHVWAIKHSPTEKFIAMMGEELQRDPSTRFFLATDSPEEERILSEKFGDRIITYKKSSLDRESIEGIQDALVDMYLLASTNKIIGSFTSSFSEVAAEIGNIPLVAIGKMD